MAELRESLSGNLHCVEYQVDRVVVHRDGKDVAAIISMEDLRLFERLVREEEDRIDIAAAEAALAESGERVSLSEVLRQLDLEAR